jgi:periplasmic protein CpxP/Spy
MPTRWIAAIASGLMATLPAVTAVAQVEPNSLIQLFPALVGVELTPAQQSQMATLSNQTLPQIQTLLTPEQQTQFNTGLAQGQGVRVAASALNLSIAQRAQIFQILQTTRSQVTTILTPAQQQQIKQNLRALKQQGR